MTKEQLEEYNKTFIAGYNKDVGMQFTHYNEEGECEIKIDIKEEHLNPMGAVHGGVIFSLADAVGGFAVFGIRNAPCTTCTATIDYLNPSLGTKTLYGSANILKTGKRMSTVEVMIYSETDKPIAKAMIRYYHMTKDFKAV